MGLLGFVLCGVGLLKSLKLGCSVFLVCLNLSVILLLEGFLACLKLILDGILSSFKALYLGVTRLLVALLVKLLQVVVEGLLGLGTLSA